MTSYSIDYVMNARNEIRLLNLYAKSVHDNIPAHIVRAMQERFYDGGKRITVEPKTEVAKARIKTGLSQSQFAALMGVSKRTLKQCEQGRREPSRAAKALIRIADLCPEILKGITS
jgi:putative transcriptional regulator